MTPMQKDVPGEDGRMGGPDTSRLEMGLADLTFKKADMVA